MLLVVFIVLTVNAREQGRQSVAANLASGPRSVAALEARRPRELQTQAAAQAVTT